MKKLFIYDVCSFVTLANGEAKHLNNRVRNQAIKVGLLTTKQKLSKLGEKILFSEPWEKTDSLKIKDIVLHNKKKTFRILVNEGHVMKRQLIVINEHGEEVEKNVSCKAFFSTWVHEKNKLGDYVNPIKIVIL